MWHKFCLPHQHVCHINIFYPSNDNMNPFEINLKVQGLSELFYSIRTSLKQLITKYAIKPFCFYHLLLPPIYPVPSNIQKRNRQNFLYREIRSTKVFHINNIRASERCKVNNQTQYLQFHMLEIQGLS